MAKKTSGEEKKTVVEKLNYPKCVEDGCWAPIPVPPPEGALMLKLKDVDADLSSRIKDDEVMSFHLTGCTGHYGNDAPGQAVADAMAAQAENARLGGGSDAAKKAAFFFHLGDIIYKDEDKKNPERADMQKLFNEQFYETYKHYPREIFAIPGNHDGKIKDNEGKSAIDHFMENFCTSDRHLSNDDLNSSPRKTMIQPYPYWVFRTPLAYFVCLYANDINGGQLDDPESDATPQFNWLVDTLKAIRKEDGDRAVFLAIHYPPFSGGSNFPERGNPNLGPTPHNRVLKPLAKLLREAFEASKLYPDAVFSAHAHLYQRLTYFCADGRQIPYLIVGSGGHAPVEALAERCDGSFDAPPQLPVLSVAPAGYVFPAGESAQMVQYNDKEHGFLRMTLDLKCRTLLGEYFAAYNAASGSTGVPALRDSFTLDLSKHRVS
ncbi:MAG TPA: metallophosphoesterase [Geobacterales bacterium]|nr:metallophosphoesterase [Geobacterales bacterium]